MKKFATVFFFLAAIHNSQAELREGDIIFQKSQSSQAPALREITGSAWTHVGFLFKNGGRWQVAEASRRVMVTPLAEWVDRGRGNEYVVKRIKSSVLSLNALQLASLKRQIASDMGRPYDVRFEWSDTSIYCSELVWKAYKEALDIEIGSLEVVGDFPLDGPEARRLIRERFTNEGRRLNLQEPIITPIRMMNSSVLETVETSK